MRRTERRTTTSSVSEAAPFRTSRRAMLRAAGAGAMAVTGGAALSGPASGSPTSARIAAPSVARARRQSGDGVTVFPRPDSRTASPYTELTFRGVTEEELGMVIAVGSQSGAQSGLMKPHADGNGVSYLPDSWFEPGEEVTVRADIDLASTDDGALVFTVSRPAFLREAPSDIVTDNPADTPHEYRSRPDLRPPVMDITMPADGTDEGYIFLGARVRDGQSGALVIDDTGEPVWFAPPPSRLDAHYDVRVQEYQGEPVVTFAEANVRGPNGWRRGHYVICDSAYERIAEFGIGNGFAGGDHHELLLTAEGTALVGTYHPVMWDLSPFGGVEDGIAVDNIIQELEVETGRVLFEWHSLDHIAIDETYSTVPTEAGSQFDYLHMNSIGVDPEGEILISARHTHAVYSIDRRTGDILWRLNGRLSDFQMGEGTPFAYTHDARLYADGRFTLFDNAAGSSNPDVQSRGIELQLDLEAMTATLVQEYLHPDEILSVSQANVQTLSNGNVFVGWGSAPVFSEYTADGELIFNGRFPSGGTSYRAYRFPWIGEPSDPPDVAVERGSGGEVTVYVSWNGATEVASWEVLAGPSADELEPVGSAPREAFEIGIVVESDEAYFAARALDDAGEVLGTSEAVELAG